MILYVRIFVVDPVIKFFLLVFYLFFLFEVFLVLLCSIFEGLHFAVELFLYFLWYLRFDFVLFVGNFERCVNL